LFTGIIQGTGTVLAIEPSPAGARLSLAAGELGHDLAVGESLAVNGVCLTVAVVSPTSMVMDVIPETLSRTNLGALAPADRVNLERSLRADSRLDGHFVLGHVDGVGTISRVDHHDGEVRFGIECDPSLARYIALKGSIAVDGVSLTVTATGPGAFEVALIPHTLEITTLGLRQVGDAVNLEVDVLARYLERLAEAAR
jgi:riboflavin synthase